jgi:hypothetical protein
MRDDMAKVVTERPRRGHGDPSKKWGHRLNKDDYDLDDHGASRAPVARRRQYSSNWKEFSDLLGRFDGTCASRSGVPGTRSGPRLLGLSTTDP